MDLRKKNVGDSVLGEDWFKNFVKFRENPKSLENFKTGSDELSMQILKDLYSDSINSQCKVHLLLMFQENPYFLIQDELILEKVITSLINLYQSVDENVDKRLLKAQLLITATTILLTWKIQNDMLLTLLYDLIGLLLETILNEKKTHIVRTAAGQCLEEIERYYPGFLRDKLHLIYTAYQNLSIPSMQSFAMLLSLCLKHNTCFLLKRCQPWCLKNKSIVLDDAPMPTAYNMGQVHNILDSIIDNVSNMSSACFFNVFINLVHVIKNDKELLPTVFKSFLIKLIKSSDILYFHLAFIFQKAFGLELFTSIEEKLLFHQLLLSVSHLCLTISHRLLYLDWLENYLTMQNNVSAIIPRSHYHHLLPGPFDGAHTQEKKIRILTIYFKKHSVLDVYSDFLLKCLSGLQRQITVSSKVKTSAAYFRSVFLLYSSTSDLKIQRKIDKLILDVVIVSPHLSTYVLDLLNCFKSQNNESLLNTSLLTLLVDHLINLPPQKLESNLQNFLPILEKAAVVAPSICKPEVTLRQLKKLLTMSNSSEAYKWITGYYILLMCKTFMRLDDIDILYHDLGELLQLLMKNSKDTQIQVQAKQYYAALTSLPKTRIKTLCQNQPLIQHQTSVTDEKNLRFQSINVMSKLSEPILELVKLEKDLQSYENNIKFESISTEDYLTSYDNFLNSENFQFTVMIPFHLKHVDNVAEIFFTIYSVVIEISPSVPYLNVPNVELPILTKNSGANIKLKFIPSSPHPVTFHLKTKFTSRDGFSYSFELPSIIIELQDVFSLIPISDQSYIKSSFFRELWEFISMKQERSCISVFRLDFGRSDIHALVEKYWKPFVIESEQEVYKILTFIPPLYHLLIQAEIVNDSILLTTLTDSPVLLPYISIYMKQLNVI